MIYFDNAATTKEKPEIVYEAVNCYLREYGVSPGRGSYSLGIDASRLLYKSRCAVGNYFGMSRPEKVVFTKNSTEAINLLFHGIVKKHDHIIISCYEHNAVLRPIHLLKEQGIIDYSIITRADLELSAEDIFKKYARDNTRIIALTLASNLTGRVVFNEELCKYFHERGIITFVDSSQGAGKIEINMKQQKIDFLAFTGHKDLLAIPGIGGLCCETSIPVMPLIQGGTGVHGDEYLNPNSFPEGLEAGTLNMPAIWALHEAITFLKANKSRIKIVEDNLMKYLISSLSQLKNVVLYDAEYERVSTCCFNIKGVTSDKIIRILDQNEICARGGIHCAILAHEAIGTVETGAVRISVGYNNTKEEIDSLVNVLGEIEV